MMEKTTTDQYGKSSQYSEGSPITQRQELHTKPEVKKECIEKVYKLNRMSGQYPPMQSTLVKNFEYNGITLFGGNLILGQASNLGRIGKFTQSYLDKLGSAKGTLPENAATSPFDNYTKETRILG